MKKTILSAIVALAVLVSCGEPTNSFFPDVKKKSEKDSEKTTKDKDKPTYTIAVQISGNETGDSVTWTPQTAKAGQQITLNYNIANTNNSNNLYLWVNGVSLFSISVTGSGNKKYTVNAADASEDNIIVITATFTHTEKAEEPPPPPAVITLDGTAIISGAYQIGSKLTVLTFGITGATDSFIYQWKSNNDNVGGNEDTYIIKGTDAGKLISCVVSHPTVQGKVIAHGSMVLYTIRIDDPLIDAEADDMVTVSAITGKVGDTITLNYTVANTRHYNQLVFSGLNANPATVNTAGTGTRTYPVNAVDVTEHGEIIIIATFVHSDLELDPVVFNAGSHISKTYGDPKFTNALATGYKGNGAITYSSSHPDVADVDATGEVTIYKTGTATITASKAADVVYAHASASYTLEVDHRTVILTSLSADKEYDGTTAADVSGIVGNLVAGDEVGFTVTGTFADKDVWNNKTVSLSNWELTGTGAANYKLPEVPPATTTATITRKPIALTNLSANKVYDRYTWVQIRGNFVGLIDGDDLYSNTYGSFDTKDVGNNKTITVEDWGLEGDDDRNYTLTTPMPATMRGNITPKPVTIWVEINDRDYDRTTWVDMGDTGVNGLISGDSVYPTYNGAAAFADKNVGTNKVINFGTWRLAGTDYNNYVLAEQPVVKGNIYPQSVTITFKVANKVYDGHVLAERTSEPILSGILTGDNVGYSEGSVLQFENKNVGTNKLVVCGGWTLIGTDASNYTLAQPAPRAEITRKTMTISVPANSQLGPSNIYGVSSVTVTFNGICEGDTPSMNSVTGLTFTPASATQGRFTYNGTQAFTSTTTVYHNMTTNYTASSVTFSVRDGQANFSGGSGYDRRIPISYQADSNYIASASGLNKHYKMTQSLSFSDNSWAEVGTAAAPFTGSFDGQGYEFGDFWHSNTIFGVVGSAGIVRNVRVTYAGIYGSSVGYSGGIVNDNKGTVENCVFKGSLSASNDTGGIAGRNSGTIRNCYVEDDNGYENITGNNNVGGIVGYNTGTVEYCYSNNFIGGAQYVGGIVGYNAGGTVQNCVSLNPKVFQKTSSTSGVARVVGYSSSGTLRSNYARSSGMDLWHTWNGTMKTYGTSVSTGTSKSISATATGLDGANVAPGTATTQYNNQSWWTTASNWYNAAWTFSSAAWRWDTTKQLPLKTP